MSIIMVERSFDTPPSDADIKAIAERQGQCLEIYGVTWKTSILSTDRKRMVCEYIAEDVESVRKVQREALAPFERIWAGTAIDPFKRI
jgi:hypothetical protein